MKSCLFHSIVGFCCALGVVTSQAQNTPEPTLPEDMNGYRHIHSLVIADQESPLFGFHHFYINETGWETFKNSGPYPYPEGTIFLGAVYGVDTNGQQHNEGDGAAYTLMQKDPAATETGGWLFATFKPDGTRLEQDVKEACFSCHQPQKDSDYVFSKPLGLSLPKP